MKYTWFFLGIFSLFLVQACHISVNNKENKDQENNYTEANTPESSTTTETEVTPEGEDKEGNVRELPKFNSLLHNISGNIVWKQGEKQRVEIQAVPEVIEQITTEVKEGGLLYIGYRDPNYQLNDNKLYIFITTPEIKAIRLSGSGNLQSKNRWNVDNLSLAISGSGNIDISLKADKLMAQISGSGNINLKGKSDDCEIGVNGAGQLAGYKFKVDNCRAKLSGSGSCALYVKDQLSVAITGSGSMTYKGSPNVSKLIEGSGSLTKQN
ncbi:MAG TPA: hypothetical protein DCS93_43280 [Microscillaceae bacterium]|nr:hypothetical protein [Microscillaceae bacterium]